MLLPTKALTWQITPNVQITATGTVLGTMQKLTRSFINAWLGVALGAPTVAGSSDGTTGAMDNTNRWTTDAKLIWAAAGTSHSWIVLKVTGMGTNCQILFDLTASNGQAVIYYSPNAGFTGGTALARPSATDQVQWVGTAGAATSLYNSPGDVQFRYTVWVPTDGSQFRLCIWSAGIMQSSWWIAKCNPAVTGWTYPVIAKITFQSTLESGFVYGTLNVTGAGFIGWTPNASTGMTGGLTTEGLNTSGAVGNVQTVPNDIDGGYPLTPCGYYSVTVGSTGKHGTVLDSWFGSTARNIGDTYPADTTYQFIQIGDVVWPWDGVTATLLTT